LPHRRKVAEGIPQ